MVILLFGKMPRSSYTINEKGRFGLHFQFWKCWLGISTVCFFMMKKALNQTEVLEPQDPKPASRASSGRPTPRLALKFGLGASLKMPNLHVLKDRLLRPSIWMKYQKIAFQRPILVLISSQRLQLLQRNTLDSRTLPSWNLEQHRFLHTNTPCINPKQANKAYIWSQLTTLWGKQTWKRQQIKTTNTQNNRITLA